MGVGIEVYNPDGTLQFSTANRLMRVLARFSTGKVDGSTTVAGLDQGSYHLLMDTNGYGFYPNFTVSGSTVSWVFNATDASAYRSDVQVTVLVY